MRSSWKEKAIAMVWKESVLKFLGCNLGRTSMHLGYRGYKSVI